MPRALYPYRIWLYLILAAAMLAAPLLQYTDSGERLGALAAGAAVLTLIAYGEIFASVRRGTRILRAMHGQRDLMFLAGVNPNTARRDIRRDLWQNGGWVALGALWVGRFALAFALAQYLHLFHLYWPHEMFAQPFNAAFKAVNYVSHNGAYQNNGVWQIPLFQPLWWQRTSAAAMLLLILVGEARLMTAIGMAFFLRPRYMQRWAVPSGLAIRVILCILAIFAVFFVTLIPHDQRYGEFFRQDLICFERNRHPLNSFPAPTDACVQTIFNYQSSRILETIQLAFTGIFEGGTFLAANTMRVNLSATHSGTGLDYYLAVEYETYSISYLTHYSYHWRERVSPLWVILRMTFGIAATTAMLVGLSQLVYWLVERRYHAVPS
jgi:hypothetical protein